MQKHIFSLLLLSVLAIQLKAQLLVDQKGTKRMADTTADGWKNDPANRQVKLAYLSDGATSRPDTIAFVVKDSGRVGIGTSSPVWQLDVQGASAIGHFKRFTGNAAGSSTVAPAFLFTRSRGTAASQADIQANDFLGKIQFRAHIGTSEPDFGTLAYVANSTTAKDGRFVFFNGSGGTGDSATMSVNTNTQNVGIGTTTPQNRLHVYGATQLSGELNVGGSATATGSAGTTGQVLTSNGAAAAPSWKSISTIPGTIDTIYYVQGTTAANVNAGSAIDVPGVTVTHTVPTGVTQTLLFTVTGYATLTTNNDGLAGQGSFLLLQGTTKISSAYASTGDGGALNNLPAPAVLMKSVTLPAGTYTFKVQLKSWSNTLRVNNDPSTGTAPAAYGGADSGDTEAMLTKMQVLVYNN